MQRSHSTRFPRRTGGTETLGALAFVVRSPASQDTPSSIERARRSHPSGYTWRSKPMKTVLAPIDFSPATEGVVRAAIALARSIDAGLVLLHVIPELRITGGTVSLTLAATDLMAEEVKD